eukprot:TRINITY_DN51968_c0_g1_i1.p1 TRINITY_DN51968_c0_g1~~TRINITY_DN51968_c0_g1_i1.p1  ORF type:complete len:441 (-),score=10.25 TRINITY_DN51968_c0_g1_i1:599-1921(-)
MGVGPSCAAVCCTACACETCRNVLGSINRSTARLAYVVLFALSLVLTWLVRDYAQPLLTFAETLDPMHFIHVPPADWFQEQAVLRVSLGTFLFFALLAALLLRVRFESDHRDTWHHGGWFVKLAAWLLLLALSFLAPDALVSAYGYACRAGSAAFLFVQAVILLDFMFAWNDAWAAKDEHRWYMAMLVVSVGAYIACVALLVLLAVWFVPDSDACQRNELILFASTLLVAALTAVSLHHKVNGSLLPASIASLYCTYLAANALCSEPRDYQCNGLAPQLNSLSATRLALSMLLALLSVAYSALRAGSSTAVLAPPEDDESLDQPLLPTSTDAQLPGDAPKPATATAGTATAPPPPPQRVQYNYSFFHLIFALAAMYSAMLMTGWGVGSSTHPEGGGGEAQYLIDVGWGSVGVKLLQQWGTGLLYVWALVAPLLLPDREFA